MLSDGWFRTGDMGTATPTTTWSLWAARRTSSFGAARTSTAVEVERALAKYPSIGEVAVVGAPDQVSGEVVVAFIVVNEAIESPSVQDLLEHMRGAGLPAWKAPRQVHVVDRLPRTPLGKVRERRAPANRASLGGESDAGRRRSSLTARCRHLASGPGANLERRALFGVVSAKHESRARRTHQILGPPPSTRTRRRILPVSIRWSQRNRGAETCRRQTAQVGEGSGSGRRSRGFAR